MLVKDVAAAPCAAGEWAYYFPNLDEIDKVATFYIHVFS